MSFTFAIALTPARTAGDWPLAQALLGLTLRSVLAQSEADFRVLVCGHDRPELPRDPRVAWLQADWPVEPPGPHNDDSGRKKHFLAGHALAAGGGLLMIVDADDWVDRRTVALARRCIGAEAAGAVIVEGEVVDLETARIASIPQPGVFGEFHRVCGSSTVARLRPGHPDPMRRDPFSQLRSHHAWLERGEALGLPLVRLPAPAAYLIGTSINHSDVHGPHLDWRRGFRRAVNAASRPLGEADCARFGLTLEAVRAVADRLGAGAGAR